MLRKEVGQVKMIGGSIIEIKDAVLVDVDSREIAVLRLWVMHGSPEASQYAECCIHIEKTTLGYPRVGDHVVWRDDKVYFQIEDNEWSLTKIGPSFIPSRELCRSVS